MVLNERYLEMTYSEYDININMLRKNNAFKIWQTLKDIHNTKQPNCCFMTYIDLFALCKKPDKSILDYSTWVTHAIANVKKLQPNKYSLEDMDNEL